MSSYPLFLSTFGALNLRWNGKDIAIAGDKPAALLAYLALEPGPHRREAIAELLWPGVPVESARHSLRQTVFNLRNLLTDATGHTFIAGRSQLIWEGESVFTSDVALLLDAVAGDPAEDGARLPDMKQAMALYSGPFLSNLSLADCQDFMDWIYFKRESFQLRALELLRRLIDYLESQGRTREALPFALRHTELEPWDETGYLYAMRLYAANGQRDTALALFETCRRTLKRDLGVLPGKEVLALAEDLRRQSGPVRNATASATMPLLEERRQVTVVFCELHAVGATDPEEAMERLAPPQALCEEIVRALGGHTVHAHGGGLLAYFGYPQAQERSAIYGLRAARRMAALTAPGLEVRVGVHQGFIVTTGDLSRPDPIGMTSDVAIQLHALAKSGEVLASGEVCRSATTYFALAFREQRRLRRMNKAVDVFCVGEESGVTHRLQAAARRTPLMGREAELRVLERTWGRAHRGELCALLISGEAGMGKSRLVREWMDRVASGENIVYELRCFAETRHSPWHPIIAAYQAMAGIGAKDAPDTKLQKLQNLMQRRVPALAKQAVPLLARMLGVPMDGADSIAEPLDKALPALLLKLLREVAARNPVLLVLEDAHWADESTLSFASRLCSQRDDAAICLLVTARPEFDADWPGLEHLTLAPLGNEAVESIVRTVAHDMSAAGVARVVNRADGIPLYAEELATLAQSDQLPGNLMDLLTVRLESLGVARTVAQLAACVGREIDEDFLDAISDMSADARRRAVDSLLSSGLMQRLQDRHLQFKHVLVQEAAYQSQAKAVRAAAHRRIAETMEAAAGDLKIQHPELLARHWSGAGEAATAAAYWLAAGRHAAANYAFTEAADHYANGLALLPKLSSDAERDKLEFSLLINLARAEQVLIGYGRERPMATMARALALLEKGVGDGIDRFHALWGMWEAAGSKSGHEAALSVARQLLAVADELGDRTLQMQAVYAEGNSLFWLGRPADARARFDRLLAMEAEGGCSQVTDFYGRDILQAIRCYLSWVLWQQGETNRAFALSDEILRRAERAGTQFDQAFAYIFAAVLHRWQGNVEALAECAAIGLARAEACQSPLFIPVQKMHLIWVAVMRGKHAAIEPLETALSAGLQSMSSGASVMLTPFAEMLLTIGEMDKSLVIIDKTLEVCEQKQDGHCLPELHRLRGECLLRKGDRMGAHESFKVALSIAKRQGAVVLEQRVQASVDRTERFPTRGKS